MRGGGRTRGRARSRCRSCAASKEGRDTAGDSFSAKLRTNVVNVRVQSSRGDDTSFRGNSFGIYADNHPRGHVSDVWITTVTYTDDVAIFNADISLINTTMIDYQCVRDDCVERVSVADTRLLRHSLAKRLTAAKFRFFTFHRQVALGGDVKVRISQSYAITDCGSVHVRVLVSRNHQRLAFAQIVSVDVPEAAVDHPLHDFVQPIRGRGSIHQIVPTFDHPVTSDIHHIHSFRLSRLESHRRAARNGQTRSVRSPAIKRQKPIRLDEVKVASHLNRSITRVRYLQFSFRSSRQEL